MPKQEETLRESEDTELFALMQQGNEDALKVLFHRHFKTMVAIARRMAGDEQEGKDIAQTIFIRFWNKREDIRLEGAVVSYLKRMTINESLAQWRTAKRQKGLREGIHFQDRTEADGEQKVIADQTEQNISQAIDKLPDKCREVFKLSRFEELSYKEISSTLNISVKTVENHMGRALRELRTSLREYLNSFFL